MREPEPILCPLTYAIPGATAQTGRKAVFLDRDGVLIEDTGYPDNPERIRILPGVPEALRQLRDAGWRLVVVSNQSGIARGRFTLETLDRIHDRLTADLADAGVTFDALYFCPHHPQGAVPPFNTPCDHRKPEPGMLLSAAHALDLAPAECWMVGDKEDDVRAGHAAGCRAARVGEPQSIQGTRAEIAAADLPAAVERILSEAD